MANFTRLTVKQAAYLGLNLILLVDDLNWTNN